jgi:tetratricopeptide (TPR) repeat protein
LSHVLRRLAVCLIASAPIASGQTPDPPDDAAAPRDATSAIQQALLDSDSRLARPSAEKLLALAKALEDRGLHQAAREVAAAAPRPPLSEIAQELLDLGQAAAADAVVELWRREAPDSREAAWMRVYVHFAAGAPEMALRSLQQIRGTLPASDERFARFMETWLTHQIAAGRPPDAIANPWGVQFVDENGTFAPGRIAQDQKDRLPPDLVESVVRLVRHAPRNGALWAFLGDLANAEGNVSLAVQCYERAANALQFAPRPLLERLRAAQAHVRDQERRMAETIPTTPAPPRKPRPGDWSTLSRTPQAIAVMIVGGAAVVVLTTLQIRLWLARRPRPDASAKQKGVAVDEPRP